MIFLWKVTRAHEINCKRRKTTAKGNSKERIGPYAWVATVPTLGIVSVLPQASPEIGTTLHGHFAPTMRNAHVVSPLAGEQPEIRHRVSCQRSMRSTGTHSSPTQAHLPSLDMAVTSCPTTVSTPATRSQLTVAAPAGGLVINISSSDPTVMTLPSSTVTVPAGAVVKTFTVTRHVPSGGHGSPYLFRLLTCTYTSRSRL